MIFGARARPADLAMWLTAFVLIGGLQPVAADWRPCGPRDANDVGAVSVDPTDADIVFATGYKKSIDEPAAWGTVDGGTTWSPVLVGASEADPPAAFFFSQSRSATYAIVGIDIFQARTDTDDWIRLGTIRDPRFQLDGTDLMSFEATPRVLLAGLGNQTSRQNGALFQSSNGGRSWTAYPELVGLAIYDILVVGEEAGTVFVATHRGVFRTRNAGRSWEGVGPEGVAARIRDLAIDKRSGVLFAATSGRGIWQSTNEGDSWTATSTGMRSPTTYSVEVDPVNDGVVWAGLSGGGIYRSADGGSTWDRDTDGIGASTSVWSIVFPNSEPDQAMIATSDGMYCW